MAGFAAALKGLMGLSDSSYKAQQEFLQTDWFNRNNLQREQIGNVGMEATRANMAAQQANLELDRRRTALAEAEASRIAAAARAKEALEAQNRRDADIRSGIITLEGTPGPAAVFPPLENIPTGGASTPTASTVTGAPVVSAPSGPAVVAPPTSSVVSVGRSATGAGFPSVQQTTAPVQTQVPPPPTAVPPAQPVQQTTTPSGRVIPPVVSHSLHTAPVVPYYSTDSNRNREVMISERAKVDGWESELRHLQSGLSSGFTTPELVNSLMVKIREEGNGWLQNFQGMSQGLKRDSVSILDQLAALHTAASERTIRAEQDRASDQAYRAAQITALQNRGNPTPLQLTAEERRQREESLKKAQEDGLLSIRTRAATVENGSVVGIDKAMEELNESVRRMMDEGVQMSEIAPIYNFIVRNIRQDAAAGRADERFDFWQANPPTPGGSGGTSRTGGYNMAPAPADADVIAVMRQNNIAAQSVVHNQKPSNISTANWNNLRSRYVSWWQAINGRAGNPPGWKDAARSSGTTGADEAAILEAAGAVN